MGNACRKVNIKTAEDFDDELRVLYEAVQRQEDNLLAEEHVIEAKLNMAVDDRFEPDQCQRLSDRFVHIREQRVKLAAKRAIIRKALQNASTRRDRAQYRNRLTNFNKPMRHSTKRRYVELQDMRVNKHE